jgi:hypothetical protein
MNTLRSLKLGRSEGKTDQGRIGDGYVQVSPIHDPSSLLGFMLGVFGMTIDP